MLNFSQTHEKPFKQTRSKVSSLTKYWHLNLKKSCETRQKNEQPTGLERNFRIIAFSKRSKGQKVEIDLFNYSGYTFVEVPGIEPGSSSTKTGLLRA